MLIPTPTPATTWVLGPKRACLVIASPGTFPFPTFVESGHSGIGRVVVVRVSDLHVVQVLAPACSPTGGVQRIFLRSPNGHLLVNLMQRNDPPLNAGWTDLNTGVRYPGLDAHVSPDGSRVAAEVYGPHGWTIIRQYDAATGRVLSDLDPGGDEGFDWSADGTALIVVMPEQSPFAPGGIYVVPRDAHALPEQPVHANTEPYTYSAPAALANGHVVLFESEFPAQREAWSFAVVDFDLQARTARTVLGDRSNAAALPRSCDRYSPGATLPAQPGTCRFTDPSSTDAQGNDVLLDQGGVWLYDGSSLRLVGGGPGHLGAVAHW